MSRHEEARKRIKKAFFQCRQRVDLIGNGPLFDRFKEVEFSSWCPTCATDGEKFFFNTSFVEFLQQPALRTVAVHEAHHVGNSHHLRLRNLLTSAGVDVAALDAKTAPPSMRKRAEAIARRANEAMDHVINNQIAQSQAYRDGFLGALPDGMWLCDPKYSDHTKWSWERVFADLGGIPPEEPECENPTEGDDGENGQSQDGDGDGAGVSKDEDGDQQGPGDSQGGSGTDSKDQDQGKDDGQGQGQSQGGTQEQTGTSGPGYSQVGGMGEVLPSRSVTKDEQQQEYQDIAEDLARGEFMEKTIGIGKGTNRVIQTLRESQAERPSEWGWMKDLLLEAYAQDRSWSRPNVYHLDHGYLPSKTKTAGDLVAWLDLSGSMTMHELEICRAELEHIAMELGIRTIYLGYFSDGPIQTEDMIEADTYFDEIEVGAGDKVEFKITGRGGTYFDTCLHATEEEGIDVQAMVVFTDGEVIIKEDAPPYPVIWATTNREPEFRHRRTYEETELWGEVVKLNIDKAKMGYAAAWK